MAAGWSGSTIGRTCMSNKIMPTAAVLKSLGKVLAGNRSATKRTRSRRTRLWPQRRSTGTWPVRITGCATICFCRSTISDRSGYRLHDCGLCNSLSHFQWLAIGPVAKHNRLATRTSSDSNLWLHHRWFTSLAEVPRIASPVRRVFVETNPRGRFPFPASPADATDRLAS